VDKITMGYWNRVSKKNLSYSEKGKNWIRMSNKWLEYGNGFNCRFLSLKIPLMPYPYSCSAISGGYGYLICAGLFVLGLPLYIPNLIWRR